MEVACRSGVCTGRLRFLPIRRNPTRPLSGPEYPSDRQRPSHLNGYCATSASKVADPSPSTGSTRKIGLNLAITACDKRGQKTHLLTSTRQSAGSLRSGRVKRCGFGHKVECKLPLGIVQSP